MIFQASNNVELNRFAVANPGRGREARLSGDLGVR